MIRKSHERRDLHRYQRERLYADRQPVERAFDHLGRVMYAKNIAAASAGANTVSCTLTGQSFTDMVGGEYSGMSTTAPLDSYGTTRFSGQDFSGCSTDCIAPSGDLYTGGGPGTIATCGTGEILVSFTYTEHAATTFSITRLPALPWNRTPPIPTPNPRESPTAQR